MGSNTEKPLIGMTCFKANWPGWVQDIPGQFMDAVFRDYSRAVEFSGGIPVLVPVFKETSLAGALLERIDGLLLTGGQDILPRFFGEEPIVGIREMDDERDVMELHLAQEAEKRSIPILGICRGIQLITVAFGGTIYQDIFTQVPGCLDHEQKAPKGTNTHKIALTKKSKLSEIVEAENIWVNSHHHQAVKEAPPGFRVSATASDGVIEAIERPDYPFLMGIQWHAEGTCAYDTASKKIFSALLEAAKVKMTSR